MARPLRLEFPGALYHLTARGDARAGIYLDDGDRRLFLELLDKEITQQGWKCYAYCLMGNHYHLLVETPEGNLAAGMRRLNGVYTQAFNRRHERVGHVLQGRYKSILVERDSYGLELCRYIVLNPVRAKMVRRAQDWAWSSYRATAGLVSAPGWLDIDWVLRQLGAGRRGAPEVYRRFVSEGLAQASPWEELRGQIWLGGDEFLRRMEKLAARHPSRNVPKAHTRPARPTDAQVLEWVAAAYRVDAKDIRSRAHQPAFQAWAYLLRRAANAPLGVVAQRCGVSPSRVSHIQRAIERGEPDAALSALMLKCKVKN